MSSPLAADWFTYDADNRVLVADGSLQNDSIDSNGTTNSGANVYDAAGDVIQYAALNGPGQQTIQKDYYTPARRLRHGIINHLYFRVTRKNEDASLPLSIEHEIHRPHLVGRRWTTQRLPAPAF